MRLTIVQYGGDYREAWERFNVGGKPTYQAQRYSVEFVESLTNRLEQVSVVCATSNEFYDVILPNKVRAVGAGLPAGFIPRDLIPHIAETCPDRLILVTPLLPVFQWARSNGVRTITTLADSFRADGFRSRIRNMRLARALNRECVEWVGNHGVSACLSLRSIGVRPDKIIPWDWPHSHTPSDYQPRQLDQSRPLRLVYVGSVVEEKGVGDLLRAIDHLKTSSTKPLLSVLGHDPGGEMSLLASKLGLASQISFVGVLPNENIPAAMRSADAVVIPSRHEYPEGLPLTIYEALAARTPILASDHPMFAGALTNEESAIIFKAAQPLSLAAAIQRLSSDPRLYARLSLNSEVAWKTLQLPVTWGAMIEHWLADTPEDHIWLEQHNLSSGLYDTQIAVRTAPVTQRTSEIGQVPAKF